MEDISQASVQSDSSRDVLVETPASESDSGDSLFVTQSVTSALRNVKRHRPSNTQACPFSQESEDKQETVQHEQNGTRGDSDSEASYADLLHRWRKLARINSTRRHRHPRSRRVPPKRMVLPFLKKSDSRKLSVHGNQTIVNSEIGGFFKCILKMNKGCKENRRELSPSRLPSEWEQNHEDNEDDDEDIRKVNPDFFIYGGHKRIRQTWLPFLKWKTIQDPRKCTEKSKTCQEEWEKSYQTRQVAENQMEPQEDTDVHNENSLFNIEESQSRRMGEGSSKFPASPSLSSCSAPSCLSPEKSFFVQNLFKTENSPQVLVTCSQSQSVDWHHAQNIDKTCENWMEPIDEMAVEETQWPCLADHDEDETQISEDNPMDRDRRDNVLCLENISSYDLQELSKDICQGVHHDTVDNKDLVSASGGFISSQDLFQEPNNQTSPLEETDVENANEKMKNCVLLHDDTDSIMKNKRCSSILADVEGDNVKYSKSFLTIDGDIDQGRKEKNKKTSDNSVEHVYPSMPLEDYTTGSRGSNYSNPSKDLLMVRQKEKTESPLFKYGGIKFLKRKKGKVPEISHNFSLIQVDPGQNEDPVPHLNDVVKQKKRKKVKNVGLLEEPVNTLPEISVSTESCISVQDSSVVFASVSGSKPKKKRKKDNVGLLEEPFGTLQEISVSADPGLSVQDSSVVCASVSGSKTKKKRKRDKNVGLLEEPVGTLQEISVSADFGLSVHDSSVVCASIPCQGTAYLVSIAKETELLTGNDLFIPEVNPLDIGAQAHKDHVQCEGHEPQRKKKRKTKKWDTSPVISDEMVPPKSSKESHLNHCTKTVKKKKQKFIYDVGEGQVAEMSADSQNLKIPAGIEIQPVNNMDLMTDETVTPKKKKRKRQEVVREENVDVEASFVETTEQVETLDTFQDSVQQAAEVVQVKKQNKKKKKTVTCHEEEVFKNSTLSIGLGDTTTSKTPNNKPETGGIDEEEGLGESEPVKKKKKKRKELDSDGSCLVSHALTYLNNSCWLNNEQTKVVKEPSRSRQKLCKEHPAPCLKMQLTNDENKKKKSERTKGDDSESTLQVLLSDDTIQLNGKKKKKKKKDG
ncbi:phoenix [Tachysurus ichikawai]